MLKTYIEYVTYYRQGEEIDQSCLSWNFYEEEPKPITIHMNWADIEERNSLHFPGAIYNFKRGHVISFWRGSILPNRYNSDVKQWKEPDLDLTQVFTYEEYSPSITEIIGHRNSEQAIQYLIQRGISVVNR